MVKILLGLFPGRAASDDADRIAADFVVLRARRRLRLADFLLVLFQRGPRGVEEERIAVFYREGLAGRRRAGVHDHRPRAAERLRLALDAVHVEIFAVKIEILAIRPDHLDDVDPFLGKFVAVLMGALLDAEHVELALVPADHDVEPETAL